MCEKHSLSAIVARSKLEEAPKDIKRLEILRPANTPTMGERYDMAIAKERRLEASSQPDVGQQNKKNGKRARDGNDVHEQEKNKEDSLSSRNQERKVKARKKLVVDRKALENTTVLEEEDEVREGIDWSASDDSSDDGSE